jgi:hypothetical protein
MIRRDVIRALSEVKVANVFAGGFMPPGVDLSDATKVMKYLETLNYPTVIDKMTYYGRELATLAKNGYKFDPLTKTFIK